MAQSTCIKCGGHRFEMVERAPSGSRFKMYFIQCAGCGVVVGVTEYLNAAAHLQKLDKQGKGLAADVEEVKRAIAQLAYIIQRGR